MKTRITNVWFNLSSSYWFVPALLGFAAVGLSYGVYAVDVYLRENDVSSVWWLYGGGISGARTILTSMATSLVTIASVVFSISLLVLSTTLSQYGPLLIRNFMHDRASQVTFGIFVATFIYCYLMLNLLKGQQVDYMPGLSVTVGILLGIVSVGVLVYFIHHMAASIQSDNVIATVGKDFEKTIARLYPESKKNNNRRPTNKVDPSVPPDFDQHASPVLAAQAGYLQAVDTQHLLHIAGENDLILRLGFRPGLFVNEQHALALVWPGERKDERICREIRQGFIFGTERTLEQDVEFAVNQIIEIAVRALSPSLNDPFIALTCVDWLGVGLMKMAESDIPSPYHYDKSGKLRIIAHPLDFVELTGEMFTKLRQYANLNVATTIRLLEVIQEIGGTVQREPDRVALLKHALMLERGSRALQMQQWERKCVEEKFRLAVRALMKDAGPPAYDSYRKRNYEGR